MSLVGGLAQGLNGKGSTVDGESGAPGKDAFGGAINSRGGDIVLDGVTFLDNLAQAGRGGPGHSGSSTSYGGYGGNASGGAIYSLGAVFVQGAGATFTGNQAVGGRGGNGGLLTTNAGLGGNAHAGAVWAFQLDASTAALSADDNLAQGGNGGSSAALVDGGYAEGGALTIVQTAILDHASLSYNRAQGGAGPHGASAQGGALFQVFLAAAC